MKQLPIGWFTYNRPDRPDRPNRLKWCAGDPCDYMWIHVSSCGTIQTIGPIAIATDRPDRTLLYRGDWCDREKATGDRMRSYVNMARRFGRFGRSKYVPKCTERREYTSRVQEWPCEIELACDQVRSYVNSEALESSRSLAHFLTRFGRFGRSERSGRLYVNQPYKRLT